MLLFFVTLKNFDVSTVTMGVACPLLRRSIYAFDMGRSRNFRRGMGSSSNFLSKKWGSGATFFPKEGGGGPTTYLGKFILKKNKNIFWTTGTPPRSPPDLYIPPLKAEVLCVNSTPGFLLGMLCISDPTNFKQEMRSWISKCIPKSSEIGSHCPEKVGFCNVISRP